MNLASVASDLYALLPEQFTAARNEKAKALAQAGDKELAREVRRLPKPSAAPWLINILAAMRRKELDEILAVGASMRQAQGALNRKRLTELGEQRQLLLASLVKDSRSLADERGQKLSDSAAEEVAQTLRAAMTDARAASAVSTGRLIRSLSASGWEPVDLAGAVAGPFDAGPDDAGAHDSDLGQPDVPPDAEPADGGLDPEDAARLQTARDNLDEAETLEEQALANAQEAEARWAKANVKKERLAAAMEDLRQRIADLKREMKATGGDAAEAERDRAEALRIAEAADVVDAARRRVEELLGN